MQIKPTFLLLMKFSDQGKLVVYMHIYYLCSFDGRFHCSATQSSIFVECVQPIVDSVLEGYNGSVIASGQTGKTFIRNNNKIKQVDEQP